MAHFPIVNFSVLVTACWQAFEARDIKCEFAEAKYIGLAVFSMFQGFLTGVPIVVVAKSIPEAFYLILTFLIFVVSMVVLLLIFLPKMLMERRYAAMTPEQQKKAMAVSVRASATASTRAMSQNSISGLRSSAFQATGGGGSNHMKRDAMASLHTNAARAAPITPIVEETSSKVKSVEGTSRTPEESQTSRTGGTDDDTNTYEGTVNDGALLVKRIDELDANKFSSYYIEDDNTNSNGAEAPGSTEILEAAAKNDLSTDEVSA